MDPAIQIVEDVAGDGTVVQRGEIVSLDLQITLNRGDVVHPHQHTTVRVGDRHVFPWLRKSIEGMRTRWISQDSGCSASRVSRCDTLSVRLSPVSGNPFEVEI